MSQQKNKEVLSSIETHTLQIGWDPCSWTSLEVLVWSPRDPAELPCIWMLAYASLFHQHLRSTPNSQTPGHGGLRPWLNLEDSNVNGINSSIEPRCCNTIWNCNDTSCMFVPGRQIESWPYHTWVRSKADHVIKRMQRANSWHEAGWPIRIKKGDQGINTSTNNPTGMQLIMWSFGIVVYLVYVFVYMSIYIIYSICVNIFILYICFRFTIYM